MLKLIAYILLTLTLVSCGQSHYEQKISDELVEYVYLFKSETGIDFHNTDIYLAKFPEDSKFNGFCYPGIGINIININQKSWETTNKEQLLAHELGHCLFGLQHNARTLSDGCPESIMFPKVIDIGCWNMYKSEYYQELIEASKRGVF